MNPANDPNWINNLLEQMEATPKKRAAVHSLFRQGALDQLLLHDGQLAAWQQIHASDSDVFLVLCARQWGKSFLSMIFAVSYAAKHPKSIVRVYSHTYDQVGAIVRDNLRLILQLAPPDFCVQRKNEKRWLLWNGSEIRLGALAPSQVDRSRGGRADLVIIEEGGFTPSEELQDAMGSVIGPQLTRSKNGRIVHVTTPSKDTAHYIHTEILPTCEQRGALARFTILDNPQLDDRARAKCRDRCATETEYLREYMAQVIRDESVTVVPEFDEARHVKVPELPPFYRTWVAGDLGGTRDRTAIYLCAYDFERAVVQVLAECAFDNQTPTSVIVAALHEMEAAAAIKPIKHWLDGSGQTLTDLRVDFKYPASLPSKQDFDAGVNMLRGAFSKDKIEVHPECKLLIATLRSGTFNRQRNDYARSEALGHCDAIAALVYAYRMRVKENPWPARYGHASETHYIAPKQSEDQAQSRQELAKLFT